MSRRARLTYGATEAGPVWLVASEVRDGSGFLVADAEDVIQEGALRAVKAGHAHVSLKAVHSAAVDAHRRANAQKRPKLHTLPRVDRSRSHYSPERVEADVLAGELVEAIARVLARRPQWTVARARRFALAFVEGATVRELADAGGMTASGAEKIKRIARGIAARMLHVEG